MRSTGRYRVELLLPAVLLLAITPSVGADEPYSLKLGDMAPEFEGRDQHGESWRLSDHFCDRYCVIYFYPGDFTPGCRKQAERFRRNLTRLTQLGVNVVGVSGDEVETHELFHSLHNLEHTLISDADGSIAKRFSVPFKIGKRRVRVRDANGKVVMFGVPSRSKILQRNITIERWTFIIDPSGRIIYKNERVNPLRDSDQVMKTIRQIMEDS